MKSLRFATFLVAALVACHRDPPPPTVLERLANAPGVTLPEVSGDKLATATPRARIVVASDRIDLDMDSLWASWPAEARESFRAAQDAAHRADLPLARRGLVKLANFVPADHAAESRVAPFPPLADAISEALEIERRFRADAKLPSPKPSLAIVADAHAPYALLVRVIASAAQRGDAVDLAFVARRPVAGTDPVFVPLHLPTFDDETPHLARVLDRKADRALASELADVLADRKTPEPPPSAPTPAKATSLWPAAPQQEKPKHEDEPTDGSVEPLLSLSLDAKGCALMMYADARPVPGCDAAQLRSVFAQLKSVLGKKQPRSTDGTCAAPPEAGCRSGTIIVTAADSLELQAVVKGMELSLEDPTLFTRVILAVMM